MPSALDCATPPRCAENRFREAFDRLKKRKSERLPKNAPISQNNIAKEAGYDPSALRKSRFPTLIAEIQRWIIENPSDSPTSRRQAILAQRRRNRSLKEKIEALKSERDHALCLLVEADAKIVELTLENLELKTKLPASNINSLRRK